ncbi:MAG: class I SAM-dependent rRNA methyltransferase, partial [Chloroflexota bacterium]
MALLNNHKPVQLQLSRNLIKTIKRGHRWVYADALRHLPNAPAGTPAILLDTRGGREIARGYYDTHGAITFRVCSNQKNMPLNDVWVMKQMERAIALRQTLFNQKTNSYRLFNGEGDGLPGLVCDIYADTAVFNLDGNAAHGFWKIEEIGKWTAEKLSLRCVLIKDKKQVTAIVGTLPVNPIEFLENDYPFSADVKKGQKTGFFIDQRDNRQRLERYSNGKTVINMFGYTGGFSVYAGRGGASKVITLDSAAPALQMADAHWQNNNLPINTHETIKADAFDYLIQASKQGKKWDVVILDPPSFAPNEKSVPQAMAAYTKLIAGGAAIISSGGILAASSCSSHINSYDFLKLCEEGLSKARKNGDILGIYGQPADHPAP